MVTGEICHNISSDMLACNDENGLKYHLHGNDWHRSPDQAIARAEEMREAKIKSLKKQIEKLESMKFEISGW